LLREDTLQFGGICSESVDPSDGSHPFDAFMSWLYDAMQVIAPRPFCGPSILFPKRLSGSIAIVTCRSEVKEPQALNTTTLLSCLAFGPVLLTG
jgi:hypothetical protein